MISILRSGMLQVLLGLTPWEVRFLFEGTVEKQEIHMDTSILVAKIVALQIFKKLSVSTLQLRYKAAVLSKAKSAAVSLPIAACMEERSLLSKPMFM